MKHSGPMVEITSLSKTFAGRPAVIDLSLQIEQGEIFGLLGHNGAGKSTTFGMLLGLVYPDCGTARIQGHCVQTRRQEALRHVGAIFETPAFYEYLSGRDNLRFFLELSGRPVSSRDFSETVALVGLTARIDDPVRKYSHGMRQRLALAGALLPTPEFLILDEPNDGLDPLGIREMRLLIRRLRQERGITFLFSSHQLHEVEQLCDRIAILHQGKNVFSGVWRCGEPRWRITTTSGPLSPSFYGPFGICSEGDLLKLPSGLNIPDLVESLVKRGVRIESVEPVRDTLESFYLRTCPSTGKAGGEKKG